MSLPLLSPDDLSPREALLRIREVFQPLEAVEIPVRESLGSFVAQEIRAPIPLPPFSQAAVDGYAFPEEDPPQHLPITLPVLGEIPAGTFVPAYPSQRGCFRIFTGAPIPFGTRAVVEWERVEEGEGIIALPFFPKPGENIRKAGEELEPGHLALPQGVPITPAVMGLLSMLGFVRVPVHRKPRILAVVTGSELLPPGEPLTPGKVYNAHSTMLFGFLEGLNSELKIVAISDEPEPLKELLESSSSWDLILFTGGISTGRYDWVRTVLAGSAEKIFYRLRQRPGKPLYLGRRGSTLLFALPGNPLAVAVCMYEYVLPAIRRMIGDPNPFPQSQTKLLSQEIRKKPGRYHFLPARLEGDYVIPLEHRDSHMLTSLAVADALIVVEEERTHLPPGSPVEVHLLPTHSL